MNYKSFISFGSFLLILPMIFAQTPQLNLFHVGYGETQRESIFVIRNTGEIALGDITISVDGKVYRTIKGILGPGAGLEKTLDLQPGEHLVEVSTPEGAYDSLTITIGETVEKPATTIKDEKIVFLEENKLYVGTVVLILILVIGIWLLTKKPKFM